MKFLKTDWINYHDVVALLEKEHTKCLTKEETKLISDIRNKLRELKKSKSLKHTESEVQNGS